MATNAELAAVLGLSREESVPNLTRRFGDWLATDAKRIDTGTRTVSVPQEDLRLVLRALDTVERFWNASTLVGAPDGAGNFKSPCAVNGYVLAAVGRAVGVMNPPGRILAE